MKNLKTNKYAEQYKPNELVSMVIYFCPCKKYCSCVSYTELLNQCSIKNNYNVAINPTLKKESL